MGTTMSASGYGAAQAQAAAAQAYTQNSVFGLIRHLLKTSEAFTLDAKTVLGDHYKQLSVSAIRGKFIEAGTVDGQTVLLNIDYIVELKIEEH